MSSSQNEAAPPQPKALPVPAGTPSGLTRTLGDFAAGLQVKQLPSATRHAVRRHTLDTLGAAIGGAAQPEPRAALAAGRLAFGAGGSTTIWGTGECGSPALAALVNGTAAHALELDDASGCDHSGAVVVPAVFAALALPHARAEEEDVLAAIAVGYEVARRAMEAAGGYDGHNGAGWHSTGTCGVFGAAAAVARLLRCDGATAAQSLGIALSFASGTWAFLADGAMTKRLHPGHAASAGLLAVELARAGLSGPAAAFEADWGGFFRTYAPQAGHPEALVADLGENWRIHRSSIKPYASCRGTHAAVEALLALRAEAPAAAIRSITIGVTQTVEKMCRGKSVRTFVDAQMSLPYAAAVAVLHGGADLSRLDEAHRGDPRVRALMDRVDVVVAEGLPSNVAARVAVQLESGATLAQAIDVPLGSPGNPLPDEALRAKFDSLAEPVLGQDAAAALAARILQLGADRDARTLPMLCRPTIDEDPSR